MRALLVDHAGLVGSHRLSTGPFVVDATDDPEDALQLIDCYEFDIVVLAVDLHSDDSYRLLVRIRQGAKGTSRVLVVCPPCAVDCKDRVLQLGADDCIAQPFDLSELFARMGAIIRRARGFTTPQFRIGSLCLDTNARKAIIEERELRLSRHEYSVLELLAMRHGSPVPKESFLNCLYGTLDPKGHRIIDVYICKLRKKLGHFRCTESIETIRGGYSLRHLNPIVAMKAPAKAGWDSLPMAA